MDAQTPRRNSETPEATSKKTALPYTAPKLEKMEKLAQVTGAAKMTGPTP